jgi:tubulin--tyrosine ligase-like protein 12
VPWLQKTYDLATQLDEFIGDYYNRENLQKDNHWIVKPPNMARSMDMIVTNNLDVVLRSLETGPKLAQKYIHRPLTIRKNKIDLRYCVLLRSVKF